MPKDVNLAITLLLLGLSLVQASAVAARLQTDAASTDRPQIWATDHITQAELPLHHIVGLATGWFHTCAITTEGGVKCWGDNEAGQLGDGTSTRRNTPQDVNGLLSSVTALAAGGYHTCALTTTGGVQCWGDNEYGQLGDGTTSLRGTPGDVSGLTNGVTALTAGAYHTCALMISGRVKCWGDNRAGQLGDGTTEDRTLPREVSGLTGGVTVLAAGGYHTCALTTLGRPQCWGWNDWGQLGDGTYTDRSIPGDVSGLASGVTALAADGDLTCALTASGGVKCWGANYAGQLGDGTTLTRSTPADVNGLARDVAALAAGWDHTCALVTTGGVKCWGANYSGQLGDGTTTDRSVPGDVSGLTSGITALAAGRSDTCGLTASGGVKCWGNNWFGQLGDGTTTLRSTPQDVSGLSGGITALAADGNHTCALTTDGGVKCWGDNEAGQLGDGTTIRHSTPRDVIGLTNGVTALAAGWIHTCVLLSSGGVRCWGNNGSGQLGDGTTTSRSTPGEVSGLPSGVTALVTGGRHTCILTTSGGVRCWGNNQHGQLGDGTTTNRSTPGAVNGLTSGVTMLAAGGDHTCALMTGGGVKCWGANYSGQLGDGTTADRSTPGAVSGLPSEVTTLTTGMNHTCALATSGRVKCWGANYAGQLGDGTTADRSTPGDVSDLTSNVTILAAGGNHTCALTTSGGVKCWGANYVGQLGDGTTTDRRAPKDVEGLTSGVMALAAGGYHTCALTIPGRPKCWGWDRYGQLGLGTNVERLTPVDVNAALRARVVLNYATGRSGSYFTVTGENLPAGGAMTVTVNNQVLTTALTATETGGLIFFLSTVEADEGFYQVALSVNPSAAATFLLRAQGDLRVQEGGGATLAVPAGIGLKPQLHYLPLVQQGAH